MGSVEFRNKASELEKDLISVTSSLKSAKDKADFNEQLEGAIAIIKSNKFK